MAGELTRITVNLTPKSVDALREAQELDRLNQTDTLNKAIQTHAYLLSGMRVENRDLCWRNPDGTTEAIVII